MSTISEVLEELDQIVEEAGAQRLRIGYFAAIYRNVTRSVSVAIDADTFERPRLIEELDVVFANRFLEAWKHHRAGRTPTRSWKLTFHAAESGSPLIVQQLLLGMNAHINLDLGIAAATVAPGAAIEDLHRDFFLINDLLGQSVRGFIGHIGDLSPWIALVDRVSGDSDDNLVRFSVSAARSAAWVFARHLAALDNADWNAAINKQDRLVELLGRTILAPGPIIGSAVWLARQRETSDVARIINHLS